MAVIKGKQSSYACAVYFLRVIIKLILFFIIKKANIY